MCGSCFLSFAAAGLQQRRQLLYMAVGVLCQCVKVHGGRIHRLQLVMKRLGLLKLILGEEGLGGMGTGCVQAEAGLCSCLLCLDLPV